MIHETMVHETMIHETNNDHVNAERRRWVTPELKQQSMSGTAFQLGLASDGEISAQSSIF